jgi:hypothetical protein
MGMILVRLSQVMADSNMDDGDMARLLIRTIDLLKQIVNAQHLLPQVCMA